MPKDITVSRSQRSPQMFVKEFRTAARADTSFGRGSRRRIDDRARTTGPRPFKATKKPVSLHGSTSWTLQGGKFRRRDGYANTSRCSRKRECFQAEGAKTDIKADGGQEAADKGEKRKGAGRKTTSPPKKGTRRIRRTTRNSAGQAESDHPGGARSPTSRAPVSRGGRRGAGGLAAWYSCSLSGKVKARTSSMNDWLP